MYKIDDLLLDPFSGDLPLRKRFQEIDAKKAVQLYLKTGSRQLEEAGLARTLTLFRQAAQRVPAYKDFLKKEAIDYRKVKTKEDFDKIPIIHKENYIRKYNLKDLVWDGDLSKYYMMSSSSGSTGDPFFWPRSTYQEVEGALSSEILYREFYGLDHQKALYVIGFAMGTWIAGPYMLAATELVSQKMGNLICVTPGTTKELFIKLVKSLAPEFDIIILAGYPPIIKDIIDEAKDYGLNWNDYNIKTFFAGETFSEKYRDHIIRKTGAKNYFTDCISVYGSADAAILGHETPLSTLVRKEAEADIDFCQNLFREPIVPSMMQYNPFYKYFQTEGEKLIFSTYSGIPLVRYAIGDRGGTFTFNQMKDEFSKNGRSLTGLVEKNNLQKFMWQLPFVYLFGRTDLTIIFYGANIYPENIRMVIDQKHWENDLSGKFTMAIEEDKNHDKVIAIGLEMAKDVKETSVDKKKLQDEIFENLKKTNSEYNIIFKSIGTKAIPNIYIHKYGEFNVGIKHRWVKR